MDEAKRKRLEAMGGRETTVAEFLQLTPEEEALVEIKVELTKMLREARQAQGLTQEDLAQRLGTKRAAIARIEACHPHVTLDNMFRALFAVGIGLTDIAKAIAGIEITYTGAPSPYQTVLKDTAEAKLAGAKAASNTLPVKLLRKTARVSTKTPGKVAAS
jgi:transcriptional regulator with XRE-family HTH domain